MEIKLECMNEPTKTGDKPIWHATWIKHFKPMFVGHIGEGPTPHDALFKLYERTFQLAQTVHPRDW